jgi:hypothetical protein
VPAAEKKRVRKHVLDKPLAADPGPIDVVGRKVKASDPAGVTAEPTPKKWCPLHETSLHDTTACRHINKLVEIHRECLVKHAVVGATHGCDECGQPSHWSRGCPGKVPFPGGPDD